MIVISETVCPELRRAFEAIERDSGGHLVGTVYPGTPIDMKRFEVPDAWTSLCEPADAGLKRLREHSDEDWQTFVFGEFESAEALRERQGDLDAASQILNGYFDSWPAEDAPQ
jgi:hypothetical protein